MRDWRSIEYLSHGSSVQQEVYTLLKELDIMRLLADYNPVLVGTVPIGIQVKDSDLDIICEVHDAESFKNLASRHFGHMEQFTIESQEVQGISQTVINFLAGDWPIELFGQPRVAELQNGYLHMIIEAEILDIMGDQFRERMILLKSKGWKTERAFAEALGLKGDPYEALLELEKLPRSALYALCHQMSR